MKIEDLRAAREDLAKWTERLRRRYGYPDLASSAAPDSSRTPDSSRMPPRAA